MFGHFTISCMKKLKALFILKIFRFLCWLFGHVEKGIDWKDKVSSKTYDVTTSETKNCNTHHEGISLIPPCTHIAQYLKKKKKSDNEI